MSKLSLRYSSSTNLRICTSFKSIYETFPLRTYSRRQHNAYPQVRDSLVTYMRILYDIIVLSFIRTLRTCRENPLSCATRRVLHKTLLSAPKPTTIATIIIVATSGSSVHEKSPNPFKVNISSFILLVTIDPSCPVLHRRDNFIIFVFWYHCHWYLLSPIHPFYLWASDYPLLSVHHRVSSTSLIR